MYNGLPCVSDHPCNAFGGAELPVASSLRPLLLEDGWVDGTPMVVMTELPSRGPALFSVLGLCCPLKPQEPRTAGAAVTPCCRRVADLARGQ